MTAREQLREHRDLIQRYLDLALDNISSLLAEAEVQAEERERLRATIQRAIDYEELAVEEYVNKYENHEEPFLGILRAALEDTNAEGS